MENNQYLEMPHKDNFYIISNGEKELVIEEAKKDLTGMYVQKYLLEKDKIISKMFMEHLTIDQLNLFKRLIEEELNNRVVSTKQ